MNPDLEDIVNADEDARARVEAAKRAARARIASVREEIARLRDERARAREAEVEKTMRSLADDAERLAQQRKRRGTNTWPEFGARRRRLFRRQPTRGRGSSGTGRGASHDRHGPVCLRQCAPAGDEVAPARASGRIRAARRPEPCGARELPRRNASGGRASLSPRAVRRPRAGLRQGDRQLPARRRVSSRPSSGSTRSRTSSSSGGRTSGRFLRSSGCPLWRPLGRLASLRLEDWRRIDSLREIGCARSRDAV